jgi:two-component system response regulator
MTENQPQLNGFEVLQRRRAGRRTKHLPVVIKRYDLGAHSYVRKPVGFGQFLEATKQPGLDCLVLNEVAPTAQASGNE